MKKNVSYSLRMNGEIRDLLKQAADRERRTVASLLDKIIIEYLQKEGYLPWQNLTQDKRQVARKKAMLPAIAMQDAVGEAESVACLVHDISTGGALLGFPKGSTLNVSSRESMPRFKLALTIPQSQESIRVDCIARHMRDTGDAIQMGCKFEPYPLPEQQRLQQYLFTLSDISSNSSVLPS